jgi:hypothetical protein
MFGSNLHLFSLFCFGGRAKATGGHGVYIHVQIHRSGFEKGVLRAVCVRLKGRRAKYSKLNF